MSALLLAPWERHLCALAGQTDGGPARAARPTTVDAAMPRAGGVPDAAWAQCEAITAACSPSFHMAGRLLPAIKRPAIYALYAFCRISDDIVDRAAAGRDQAAEELALWRAKALAPAPAVVARSTVARGAASRNDLVAAAWAHTRAQYAIPTRYAEQLLDGVGRDLRQTRYRTFAELATYAYGVASTVGLMSMHITGFRGPQAIPYAVRLGVALQLTNILRDVGEDVRAGRIYLPQAELACFGLSVDDLEAGRVDDRWRAFMRFQIGRNRRLYDEAWPGIALLDRQGQPAIAAAGRLYRAILDDIEAHDYDVFRRRARVAKPRKLAELVRACWHLHRPAAWSPVAAGRHGQNENV